MEEGAITEQGSHAELIASDGYYAKIYNKQLIEQEMSI